MTSSRDNRRTRRLGLRDQRGAALVEFTLVLPVLLLVLIGMLEFGRVFNYWIDETHLANVAARFAAVDRNPGPGGTLQESVQGQADTDELRNGGTASVPAGAEVCIEFPDGTSGVGDPVEATVSVDYNWMPFIGDAMGGVTTTTLTGSATMRLEAEPSEYSEGCS
ncbi:MAG TPA: TadE/TadG family type IV pilus assembly protein [Solirubrobacterales bacterium]|nr:TadE/TadG family type IV pilus assembly protein [Solirubrobacterales bacterium]